MISACSRKLPNGRKCALDPFQLLIRDDLTRPNRDVIDQLVEVVPRSFVKDNLHQGSMLSLQPRPSTCDDPIQRNGCRCINGRGTPLQFGVVLVRQIIKNRFAAHELDIVENMLLLALRKSWQYLRESLNGRCRHASDLARPRCSANSDAARASRVFRKSKSPRPANTARRPATARPIYPNSASGTLRCLIARR